MKSSVKPRPQPVPSWDLVQPSLRLVRQHFDQLLPLFVLPSLLLALGTLLLGDTSHIHNINGITSRQQIGIFTIGVSVLWSIINFAPSIYFRLEVAHDRKPDLATCYRRGLPYFWRLAGLNLLLLVIVLVGLVLLIIPGVILGILFISRYYLANYYLVDRNVTIKEALRQSHHETAPVVRSIWGIVGVQLMFSITAALINASFRLGVILSAFIGLICLYLPALRYWEIKRLSQ